MRGRSTRTQGPCLPSEAPQTAAKQPDGSPAADTARLVACSCTRADVDAQTRHVGSRCSVRVAHGGPASDVQLDCQTQLFSCCVRKQAPGAGSGRRTALQITFDLSVPSERPFVPPASRQPSNVPVLPD